MILGFFTYYKITRKMRQRKRLYKTWIKKFKQHIRFIYNAEDTNGSMLSLEDKNMLIQEQGFLWYYWGDDA